MPMRPQEQPDDMIRAAERPGAGRYRLEDRIGAGSTGEVWRALDPAIDRAVAIKLLRIPPATTAAETREWRERFLREARAAGRLSHPGIVPVFDVGETSEGIPFIVMELVPGLSLEAMSRRQPLPPATQVLAWGAQLAEALDTAHRMGIVHRDVKPANILIDASGRARLTDFGIARLPASELTHTGLFLGSPAFAAPEQLRGEPVDARSDLFSLASSLYTLLTGRKPFAGRDIPELAYAICHAEPERPGALVSGLPEGIDPFFRRALSKEPALRHASGSEMAREMLSLARGSAPELPSPGTALSTRALDLLREAIGRAGRSLADAGRLGAAHWRIGWARGPRTRVAMVVASAIVLLALAGGALALAGRIAEARRDTPGRKMKKAFRSLFNGAVAPPAIGTGSVSSAGWPPTRE